MSPEECVYTHDPTGLNVLRKGCAYYCNQTFLVSLARGYALLLCPAGAAWAASPKLGCLPVLEKVSRPEGPHPPPCSRDGTKEQKQLGQWGWPGVRRTFRRALSLTETWLLQRVLWA